jgi:hypothetical protein
LQVVNEAPENNPPIKMEVRESAQGTRPERRASALHPGLGVWQVGIEDCLHIEFEYNKSRYHLRDVVHGKIFFLLVRIKIKNMEVAIIRRESPAAG